MNISLDGELDLADSIWPIVATVSWEACDSRKNQLIEGICNSEWFRNINMQSIPD